MNSELVTVAGRRAHIARHTMHPGVNNFNAVQVTFEDTGETRWIAAALVMPVDAPEVITLPMSYEEASARVQAVKTAAQDMGKHLLELKERDGWKAMGYASWTAFLEGEFEYSRQHLYTLMAAAPVQEKLSTVVDSLSTKAAAALSKFDESLQVVIAQTAQARYGEVTESNINRIGEVVQTMVATGHVDVGNGTSTPIDAALDTEDVEAHKRQQAYLADKQKLHAKLFDAKGSLERVITELNWMRFERETAGCIVRLVLYVEEGE